MRKTTNDLLRGLLLCLFALLFFAKPAFAADLSHLSDAARKVYESTTAAFDCGMSGDPEPLYVWSRRWLEAELREANATQSKAAYTAHRDRMKVLNEKIDSRARAGTRGGSSENVAAAEYYLAEAEEWAKGKPTQ